MTELEHQTNFNRMTIRAIDNQFQVFKLKRAQHGGHVTDLAAKRFSWSVATAARPQFTGSYTDCAEYIATQGAQFMSEHSIPV